MKRTAVVLTCVLLAIAGPAEANRKSRGKPIPPPRVWLLLNSAGLTAALRYGYGHASDPGRTILTCEDSGVIKVEQFVSGKGDSTLVVDSAGERESAAAEVQADTAEGTAATGISATFAIDRPVIQAFRRTGALRLSIGALTRKPPPAPQDQVTRFMEHCAP